MLAVLGAIAFTIMTLLIKSTVSAIPPEKLLFYVFLLGTILLFAKLIGTGQNLTIGLSDLAVLTAIALCSVLGNVLLFTSYKVGPNPGYVDAVASTKIVLIVILSAVLLGSKLNVKGLLGALLVLAGVILLLISQPT